MKERGILIVVSGFSGAGKGTLMSRLLSEEGSNYALSISATTREPRDNEVHGVNYYFISKEEFKAMIARNEFYEYTQYGENYYGTPRKYVDQSMEEGKDVIFEIEVKGAENIRKIFPGTALIFVTPPSVEELKRRLIGRNSESGEEVARRLDRAREEAEYMPKYDYILVNDDLDQCVEDLKAIIRAERMKSSKCGDFINKIHDEWQ